MTSQQPVDIHGKPYNRSLLVGVLLIGTFCTILNQTLLTTALPTLMKEFDISASSVQWLTTGFLLVNGIMIPISAWLINKFSSKIIHNSDVNVLNRNHHLFCSARLRHVIDWTSCSPQGSVYLCLFTNNYAFNFPLKTALPWAQRELLSD